MPLKLVLLRKRACAECDRQHAVWEQVRREAPGSVDFRAIEMEEGNPAVEHYKATMHPTTILERDGHELMRWTGVTTKEDILRAILEHQERETRPRAVELQSGPALPPPGLPPQEPSEHIPPSGPSPMEPPGPPG